MSTSQFFSPSIPLLPATSPFSSLLLRLPPRAAHNRRAGIHHSPASPPAAAVQALLQTVRAQPFPEKVEVLDRGFHSIHAFNDLLAQLVVGNEFELALKLISEVKSYGLVPDVRTNSILVGCYCSQDDPFSAATVLDRMVLELGQQPSVATFTTVINGFCSSGRMRRAFEVFEMMGETGCEPTICTYNCLLKGLCYVGRVEEAFDMFTRIKRTSEKKPDVYTYTALMNGFCKVGRSDEALELLDEAVEMGITPNAATFNTLFNGFFKEGRPLHGVELLKRIQADGHCSPDYVMYNTLLHGLLKWGEVQAAMDVYREMVGKGFEVDSRLMNALLRMMCRRARKDESLLKDVYELFGRMRKSGGGDIMHPSYDMSIEAFCSGGEVEMAVECLVEMITRGIPPKSVTFRRVVQALCREGKAEEAVSILAVMNAELDDRMRVNSALTILIDETNRFGMLVSSWNVYGAAAIKRGVRLEIRNSEYRTL